MKKRGGPVRKFPLAEQALRDYRRIKRRTLPDFSDTQKTFQHLSDQQLRRSRWLFELMGQAWLTDLLGRLGMAAVKWRIPGITWLTRNTIYRQFVGGTSLLSAHDNIEALAQRGVTSILDYGAEAKQEKQDLDLAMKECLKAIDFCTTTDVVIGVVVKLSALIPFDVLAALNDRSIDFTDSLPPAFKAGLKRLDAVCARASQLKCQLYIDAEESWIQNTIDQLTELMMQRYNTQRHNIYTTCQLYRHDRLDYLMAAHRRAVSGGYKFSLKLVRGAYMNKERARAEEHGYPSPIQPDLAATHRDFNAAVAYCIDHVDDVACCVASHNEASINELIETMAERGIRRDHPNVRFTQLLGMSDNLTYNLAAGGYNVSKYMVYGPVAEVLPYLVRRAHENTSITGEAGRELNLLKREIARRRAVKRSSHRSPGPSSPTP